MREMVTGLRPETFENLQLGAGLLVTGFDWRQSESTAALRQRLAAFTAAGKGVLGAMRSGQFRCAPRMRAPEGAARNPYVGGLLLDGWDVRLQTALLEITPENLARALGGGAVERPQPDLTVVRPRYDLAEEDYLPSLCWVGETGRGCCLIEMENVLCVTGAALSFRERGEGTLPVMFVSHESGPNMWEEPPCRIVFFD